MLGSRDELAMFLGLELFAVDDGVFMEMFVAPGAMENLQKEQAALEKRCSMLKACLQEFRSLARSKYVLFSYAFLLYALHALLSRCQLQ